MLEVTTTPNSKYTASTLHWEYSVCFG